MYLTQHVAERRPQAQTRVFNFRYLLAKNAVHLGIKLEAKGLFLDIAVSTDTPRYFHGNPALLEKILENIVRHSMEYLKCGGITIRITSLDFSAETNHLLQIVITETSHGLMPDKVYSLNQSLKEQKGEEEESLSPPLRDAASSIKSLNGDLTIESDYGWGTRYLVTLNMSVALAEGRL